MAFVSIVNRDLAALGLWDVDRVYHVARGMGGTMVLDPDMPSQQIVDLLASVGTIEVGEPDPPENTREPSLSGTAAVGETLTLDPGDWNGATSFDYQWEFGGVPTEGGDGLTFVVPPGTEGQWVTVVVTATGPGGSVGVETDQYGPIAE